MRRKKIYVVVSVVLAVGVVIAGCATTGQSAGLGALIGGATGAVIGHQSGHELEGAAIGAAIGGLAGWAVHKAITKRTRTAQETVSEYKYRPDQGFKLDLKDATIDPGSVARGGSVVSKMEYVTLGTGSGIAVEEARVLKKDGAVVTEIKRETATRTDGTWENTLQFKVPKDAAPGQYVLAQEISAKGLSYNREMPFTVTTQVAEASPEEDAEAAFELAAAN